MEKREYQQRSDEIQVQDKSVQKILAETGKNCLGLKKEIIEYGKSIQANDEYLKKEIKETNDVFMDFKKDLVKKIRKRLDDGQLLVKKKHPILWTFVQGQIKKQSAEFYKERNEAIVSAQNITELSKIIIVMRSYFIDQIDTLPQQQDELKEVLRKYANTTYRRIMGELRQYRTKKKDNKG